MFTEPSVFLGTAAAAGLVAMVGLAVVTGLGRGGATRLTIRIVAIVWFVLVLVLDVFPVIICAVITIYEWDNSFVPAATSWSFQTRPFWEALGTFVLALVPLVLAVFCVAWNWNRWKHR